MEVKLAKELWRRGYRYRKNNKDVFGKPDLTFKKLKIAIFVDGEFFHGKDWSTQKYRIKSNREFWWKKIEGNIARDKKVNAQLRNNGWKVLRFWSKEIHKEFEICLKKIEEEIKKSKMLKYSEVKELLNINVTKPEQTELAYLTHYLQSQGNASANHFKEPATEYIKDSDFDLQVNEKDPNQITIPIKWDVPYPPPKKPKFKFIDLFAGIGGFRLAFQKLGGKCVFTSEWNHFAQKTYEANFGEVPFGDITKIDEENVPDHDILIAGFPCQPFSIAGVSKKNALGRQHGFKDETQGTLFFDIVRILEKKKPKTFLLENVKNLVSHDKGKTFIVIREALKELGYNIHYKVLDGKYYVPQHRERILIVGFREDLFKGKEEFEFPEKEEVPYVLEDILKKEVEDKYTLSDKLWKYLQDYAAKHKAKGNGFGFGLANMDGVTRTLSARYYKDGSEILIPQEGKNPRRLTPRECARLQGYPDNFLIPVSDNQAYKQFGNSVVSPLMEAVGENIVIEIEKLNGRNSSESDPVRSGVTDGLL
jgi:DNA (cytosine-5)-methyltransferase 1